jgi:hypothetical protein
VDIHKPHAAKSWREFFIEIGTIVTGILIALTLEQIIERFHEQRIATEARAAVRAEVEEDLWWLDRRTLYEACIRSRLQQIGQILDAANHARPFTAAQSIGFLPHVKLTMQRWEANAEAGRASLFTPDEQRDYDNIYFTFNTARQAQTEEESLWSGLKAIEGQDRLTPEAIYGFGNLLSRERYQNAIIQLSMLRASQHAAVMHLVPVNTDPIIALTGKVSCPAITAKPDGTSLLSQWYGDTEPR